MRTREKASDLGMDGRTSITRGRRKCRSKLWSRLSSWVLAGCAILQNGGFRILRVANREIGVPGKGAAPGPSMSGGNETRLYGILVDVVDGLEEMRLVANETVPIFA